MEKTSKLPDHQIGGFDESYLDDLDPNAPDFVAKYIEAVTRPITIEEKKK